MNDPAELRSLIAKVNRSNVTTRKLRYLYDIGRQINPEEIKENYNNTSKYICPDRGESNVNKGSIYYTK